MNDTFQSLMRHATRLTQSGRLAEATEATEAIQRALGGTPALGGEGRARANDALETLDGCVFESDVCAPVAATPDRGEFIAGVYAQSTRPLRYKLYVPPGAAGRSLPMVVMLHGCTQNPDDFAAGTGMNECALEQGFFVLYPEQSRKANPQGCWNWFKHNHQRRGSGEPEAIAGMMRSVAKQHGIDPRRVYVAGLSAGGAMAAVMATEYPELFAAVGIHSGLPAGAVRDMAGALTLMRSGEAPQPATMKGMPIDAAPALPPLIVFHGDEDRTVHPRNGDEVIAAAVLNAAGVARVAHGVSPHGRRYTRTTHHGDQGEVFAEHWLVHGAGHAWSGGRPQGSYTDPKGPDATQEMLRFFFEHPLVPRH